MTANPKPPDDRFRTSIGGDANGRVEAQKGPYVQSVEGIAHDLADSMVANVEYLRAANGPIPAFQQPLSPERQAALHLPQWFVDGNAHPHTPYARDYWDRRVADINPSSPAAAGPSGARLFQQQMAQMWKNPKYRAIALDSMPDEMRRELVRRVQAGEHPGHAQVLVGGRVQRLEEDGSIHDHLPNGLRGGR